MSLTPFEFRAPRMSKVGRGVAGQVGAAARDLGGNRALIVGDAAMECAGYVDAVERALADAGLASARYAGVNTEPTDAHCEEAFISRRANPISDGLAVNAMGRIARSFRRAYERGDDLEAREQMLLGALEAGLAFSNASVALVHGMARPIGAYFGIAHGLSNAMLLPHVMEYTFDSATERFAEIARALGEPTDGLSVESAARRAVTAVQQLCRDLSVPTLGAAGVGGRRLREVAAQMAEDALASGSPGNNPRVPTSDEIVALYLRAL